MVDAVPLMMSKQFLTMTGTRTFFYHQNRVPKQGAVVVVSNHRSFMDAPLLMAALDRPIRFACHHYMGQVPVLRDVITQLGCFPLDHPEHRRESFFHQATQLLQTRQAVGIFPEGGEPMVHYTPPESMSEFQRGFAHLALRAPVNDLAVLPVAIASQEESHNASFPLQFLSLVDPSEPLFREPGWHPMVFYRRVHVLIGHPIWISPTQRKNYRGKQAKAIVGDLIQQCHEEIHSLLHQII